MANRPDLSPREAAAILGVSQATVRTMIKDGGLSAYRIGKGWEYRIRQEDLDALRTGKPTGRLSSRGRE